MKTLPVLLLAAVLAGTLSACTQPDTTELFIRSRDARDGVYVFPLPLADTTAAYDFWFYSRVGERPLEGVQLNVRWIAPSGRAFSEVVYMRSVGAGGTKERYRSGMVPAEAGDWQLSVRPVGTDDDFLGLGLICKKRNGTR